MVNEKDLFSAVCLLLVKTEHGFLFQRFWIAFSNAFAIIKGLVSIVIGTSKVNTTVMLKNSM